MTDEQKKITETFVAAYLDALPTGMATDEHSFNRRFGEAIGAGLAAVLVVMKQESKTG